MSNYHVLIVHFPIALLAIYSVLEILRIPKLQDLLHHFHIKAFTVILGTGAAVAAGLTGKLIENRVNIADRRLVEIHSSVAQLTTAFFGIFALLYILAWAGRENMLDRLPLLRKYLPVIEKIIASRWMILAGFIGLGLITLTGTLGGILVYGPNVDPVAGAVYKLLNLAPQF